MLHLTRYLVKEKVGFFSSKAAYDIHNLDDGKLVGVARETTSMGAKLLRNIFGKDGAPMKVTISESEKGPPVVEIRRGLSIFSTKYYVHANGKCVGYLKKKVMSIGGGFTVCDEAGNKIADLQGNWKGGTFKFLDDKGKELGVVTKKWAGMGKELFTSADNYVISINEGTEDKETTTALLLAAGIAVDLVYNE